MKKNLQLIRKTQVGFGAVLAVLLVVGIVSYRSLAASTETERWVQHTHEVLEHLETLILESPTVWASSLRLKGPPAGHSLWSLVKGRFHGISSIER
jgi:hypothetical protein